MRTFFLLAMCFLFACEKDESKNWWIADMEDGTSIIAKQYDGKEIGLFIEDSNKIILGYRAEVKKHFKVDSAAKILKEKYIKTAVLNDSTVKAREKFLYTNNNWWSFKKIKDIFWVKPYIKDGFKHIDLLMKKNIPAFPIEILFFLLSSITAGLFVSVLKIKESNSDIVIFSFIFSMFFFFLFEGVSFGLIFSNFDNRHNIIMNIIVSLCIILVIFVILLFIILSNPIYKEEKRNEEAFAISFVATKIVGIFVFLIIFQNPRLIIPSIIWLVIPGVIAYFLSDKAIKKLVKE